MKMKRFNSVLMAIIHILFACAVTSCVSPERMVSISPIENILSIDNEMESVATEYSVTYSQADYRKMFVFAVPVREFSDAHPKFMNNYISPVSKHEFETINSNYKVRYHSNSIEMQYNNDSLEIMLENGKKSELIHNRSNMYNSQTDGVLYGTNNKNVNVSCAPSYNGLTVDLEVRKPIKNNYVDLKMDFGRYSYLNDKAGYVQIKQEDQKIAVLYPGVSSDKNERTFVNGKLEMIQKQEEKSLRVYLNHMTESNVSYPLRVSINMDFYTEKMFFDTSVYEDKPNLNSLLDNVSKFNTRDDCCQGYTYIKLNLNSLTPNNSEYLQRVRPNWRRIWSTKTGAARLPIGITNRLSRII